MNCTNCSCVYKVENLYIVLLIKMGSWFDTVPLGRCYAYIHLFYIWLWKTMKKVGFIVGHCCILLVTLCFITTFFVMISFSNVYVRKRIWFAWEWVVCLFYFGYFSSNHPYYLAHQFDFNCLWLEEITYFWNWVWLLWPSC